MRRILGILIMMIISVTTAMSRQMSVAHELAHGTNSLHHTFSPESETFYTTKETDNLMDYHAGTTLTHTQWQWSHEKHRNVLGFLDDEGESEMRENTSIKWLGDWLEGYYYDDLEKLVENDLSLYDKVALNFDSYYEKSAKENVGLESWSVRKSAHTSNICGKIFEKISKKENPQFTLHEKGIFTQKDTLEGKEYRVAILSYAEKCTLESKNIKLTSYSKLVDNKYIKAGYTKRSDGYGIIAFFDGDKPTMIIQIIDSEPQLAVEKWLNYLSLILPSDEQKIADGDNISGFNLHSLDKLKEIWEMSPKDVELSGKTIETLEKKDKLSVSEIKEYRDYIEKLPEEERADWYLELQKKVPYHNQRDNESTEVLIRTCNYIYDEENNEIEECGKYVADDNSKSYSEKPYWANKLDEQIIYGKTDKGDTIKTHVITKYSGNIGSIMCNLTSLSMGFEYLGIPCPDQNIQFEDYLEKARENGGLGYRGSLKTWSELAKKTLHVEIKNKPYNNFFSKVKDDFTKDVLDLLKTGKFVIMSVWPSCKGHIVRIVSISDDGITVDDPFGAVTDFNVREKCNSGGYDSNDKTSESAKGHHVLWRWTDIENVTIKYISYSK